MIYPKLNTPKVSRQIIDTFYGYNHQLSIKDGEFYETQNLTSEHYPLFASRNKRSTVTTHTFTSGQGMIEKDCIAYVDNGTLYVNHSPVSGISLTAGEKNLIGFGAYILIFPDKVYYNTAKPTDYGSMEATYTYTGAVSYAMCKADGTLYTNVTTSATEPTDPADGALWNDSTHKELKQYSKSQGMWVSISSVYTKCSFNSHTLYTKFNEYDGVTVSGLNYTGVTGLDGEKIIYAVGGSATESDYIVVVGLIDQQTHQEAAKTISIVRDLPNMDYVCECQNRLWGCYYGNNGSENINEIYCSALGDFKNWSQYLGISTDSYTASVGSDGQWTGCINYLGYPTFFKENHIHTVNVSSTGAHQITELPCPGLGVQKGSFKSLQIVDRILYYKGRTAVCAYDGNYPSPVSDAITGNYYNAVGGAYGKRYYLDMKDSSNVWHLFVYDTEKGLWMHEDNLHVNFFSRVDDSLYALTSDNRLLDLNGKIGTEEADFEWEAVTGLLHTRYKDSSYTYGDPDQKFVGRYDIRAQLKAGSELQLFIEYDSSGTWDYAGTMRFAGITSVNFPIRPRRCDHLRLKFKGKGYARILSIARNLERMSDLR